MGNLDMTDTPVKGIGRGKGGGRPKKEVKGEAVWIPDLYVSTVKEFLTMLKNIHQQQQA